MNKEEHTPDETLSEQGRDVWRAGLGALGEADPEGERLFDRLVRRGQAFEEARLDEAEALVRQLGAQAERLGSPLASAAAQTGRLAEQVEQLVAEGLTQTMQRLDVARRSEIEGLSKKVSRLTDRVDRLRRLVEQDPW